MTWQSFCVELLDLRGRERTVVDTNPVNITIKVVCRAVPCRSSNSKYCCWHLGTPSCLAAVQNGSRNAVDIKPSSICYYIVDNNNMRPFGKCSRADFHTCYRNAAIINES